MVRQQAFSLKEAAKLLGCNRETLRRAIKAGQLKASKVGRDYRISKVELAKFWIRRGGETRRFS
ncbi:MAG: helix-turn-helix domain-containing protein [Desulfobacterales bacterium]|nr:helix-turn-helix domain-containing protein [Desulfobacterales bacterium]